MRGSILSVIGSLLFMGRQYISPKSCTYKSLFFSDGISFAVCVQVDISWRSCTRSSSTKDTWSPAHSGNPIWASMHMFLLPLYSYENIRFGGIVASWRLCTWECVCIQSLQYTVEHIFTWFEYWFSLCGLSAIIAI